LIELKQKSPEYYLKKFIQENLHREISIQSAAEYIGRSASFITHTFRELYGTTFYNYVLERKIELAIQYLKLKSIEDTSALCGFKNRYHFSKVFKKITGQSPGEYQKSQQ
jgi:two-component system response regulator YesN